MPLTGSRRCVCGVFVVVLIKKIFCIDGKTMCENRRNEEKPAHIVTAWSKEDGFPLGQKAVGEKSNGITAIPELLDKIQI